VHHDERRGRLIDVGPQGARLPKWQIPDLILPFLSRTALDDEHEVSDGRSYGQRLCHDNDPWYAFLGRR
jgi:hypothetical protein